MFGIPSNVLVGIIGVLALVLMNTNLLSYVKDMFTKKAAPVINPSPVQDEPVKQDIVVNKSPEIYEIVEQWDTLRRMCQKSGLEESVKSLDTVFLNLLKRAKLDEKNVS